jgi:5'-3' exonuclease
MGIPSYFSYIIKNYPNIIRNLRFFSQSNEPKTLQTNSNDDSIQIDNLFMDCNSIIYDNVHALEKNEEKYSAIEFESILIKRVIEKIEEYIQIIRPTHTLYIAFDGVAPFAKMQQQRTRRYKSQFMSSIHTKPTKWNTSAITPGTKFMEKLSRHVVHAFKHAETKYNIKNIVVSASNEIGEGEHKLMKYIRDNNLQKETIALYGLDADLIMLSIFHLKYCENVYVFREAPEFIKNSIPVAVQGSLNDLYFLDIFNLSNSIVIEMDCKYQDTHRINDYVFICFLLGNDFLPHFPAMNIRTHGIQALMDIYRLYIGNVPDRFFISKTNNKIQWKNVGIFINEIAKREHEFLVNEYFVRDKFDKYHWVETTDEEKENVLLNTPVIYRADEKYICPDEYGWENRYYSRLFHHSKSITTENQENQTVDFTKSIAMNYLEGLEWVYKYYTEDCPSWKWKYNYHYPPLFKDLYKYIPHFEMDFIQQTKHTAYSEELQLSYVLPSEKLDLLPPNICNFLKTNYPEFYPQQYEFQWAFCRYFWESHPLLPEIPVQLLDQWDIQFRMNRQ